MGVDGKITGGGGEGGEIETGKSKDEIKAPSKQQQVQTTTTSDATNNKSNRYWMSDIYRGYSYPRGYGAASGLAHLAWAQAVQNKPLTQVFVDLSKDSSPVAAGTDNNNNNKMSGDDSADVTAADGGKQQSESNNNNNVEESDKKEEEEEIESEIEEGELEEGEIDGEFEEDDSKTGIKGDDHHQQQQQHYMHSGLEMEDEELEVQVSSIRKVLDNVTVSDAHKSFDIVCARLRSSLESLRELVLHTWFPSKDDLIQQAYSAILSVYSVFTSMTPALRDHNKDKFSRLLTFVMSLSSVLFTPDQKKEVEAMVSFVTPPPPPAPSKPKPREDRQKELPVIDKAILTDSNTLSVNASDNNSNLFKGIGPDSSVNQSDQRSANTFSDALKQFPFPSNIKTRGGFGPLLDLHKVHDEDSLPSPTSKTTPSLPFFGTGAPLPVHSLPTSNVHPYETEAVNAISSYNQKFLPSTFYSQDTLPSPTPSEEGTTGGADDSNEEVSSFPIYNPVKNTNSSPPMQPIVSSTVTTSGPALQAVAAGVSAGPLSYGSNPASRHPGKSRDPRLSHLNYNSGSMDLSFCPPPVTSLASKLEAPVEGMNPKKSKAPEAPVLDSPARKRQRNGLEGDNKVQSVPGSIGLDTSRFFGLQPATRVGPVMDPRKQGSGTVSYGMSNVNPSLAPNIQSLMNGSTAESLQSLLKGIPAAVFNVMKEQQRSSEPFQNLLHPANSNSLTGQVTLPITAPTISSGGGQTSVGLPQPPSQIAVKSSQDDVAKPCLKPRDPRRALQTTAIQRSGSSVSEQPKVNETTMNPAASQTSKLPDIAMQFTKNLLNIADIVSVPPQTSTVQPSVSLSSSQSLQVNLDRVNVKSGGPEKTSDQRTGSLPRPEEVVPGRVQSQNHWGDVEHLFEGYDDQQRAAIQQERARRIDEQKNMFAARKLCLVLDLDHTLLNSAKFTEVDPTHDEILRKKEEQDREKPRRHLFRFPHMGMWTKLRPGVWNFLEKASKLYELHLYTMGNKLYATEMAKVLDPKGSLFSGRVISRGDDGDLFDGDERVPKSKDLDGVLGMESAVVIIDDSVRVWPHNKLNLIVVERYTYFPCSRRQFGLPGPSLLEIDHDERPEEGTLASSLAVIERIHQNFFTNKSLDDVDVRNILASEQRKILAGCRIVFSRVFPVGEASPHLHPLWQTAEQFGAVCTNQMDDQVTHVVANSLGTDKVNWALSNGKFVVHPGWVEASALLYRRANEQDFAIKA